MHTSYEDYSKEFASEIEELLNKFTFFSKTLKDWIEFLKIKIPNEPTFDDIITISGRIDYLSYLCHNNLILAKGILSFRAREAEKKKIETFVSIKEKMSFNEKEYQINHAHTDMLDSVMVSEYIVEFWQEQIKLLEKKNKLLEQIFWSLKNNR